MDASGAAYWLFDDEERHARRAAKILLHIFHPLFFLIVYLLIECCKVSFFWLFRALPHYPPQVAGGFFG